MSRTRLIVAALLFLLGAVWIGQGTGVIGGSFMSSQPFWAFIGAIVVAVAGVVAWQGWRAGRAA